MRNPKWQRDELILALDLYFDLEPGQIHARNPDVIALSDTLNQLPIHGNKREFEKFRNPNGVSLDRKSTRLNSSHVKISYAVFCLKKKKKKINEKTNDI